MCAPAGGCGACVVLVARYNAASKRVEELTINSCLAPLCSLDLCSIVTTEGLGNSRDGFHAVQKRLAGFHASQCGFCTPGMAMALYGALRKWGPADGDGSGGLTAAEAEKCVQGNICRCTGYRPILDACKSFARDVDLEDLGVNAFWSRSEDANWSLLPAYEPAKDPAFPHFLVEMAEKEESRVWSGTDFVDCGVAERHWMWVGSMEGLFAALRKYEGQQKTVRLVVGNTSQGVYKHMRPQVFIDISGIPELLVVGQSRSGLEVGSAVSLSELIRILEDRHSTCSVYAQLAVHLHRLASVHVRNRASVGGNLIMAQQQGFDSDLATILLGAGASVKVASCIGHATLSLEEFLEKGGLDSGAVLVSIFIPAWDVDAGTSSNGIKTEELVFKTYRASPRRLGNAVSYANAAFLARVERVGGEQWVRQARLAFGAFGGKHAVLAREVQDVLVGKELSAEVVLEAVTLLRSSVVPSSGTLKAHYRASVVVAYMFDFLRSFLEHNVKNGSDAELLCAKGTLTGPLICKGSQKFARCEEFHPVGLAAPKVMAELQASGVVRTRVRACMTFQGSQLQVCKERAALGNLSLDS